MFIDSHAHLFFDRFADDFDDVVNRAREMGVGKIVNVACALDSAGKVIEAASKYDELYATVGLHPYDSKDYSADVHSKMRALIQSSEKVVAVGETGLDYYKCEVPREKQIESFRAHLELAKELSLPVIVHNRDAEDDCLRLIDEFPGVKVVFHCFASSLDYAKELWSRGHYTSFTGIITYPNAGNLLEVVKMAPNELIMIETDCPYLAPQSKRGERNEPAFVVEVAEKIAEIKELDLKGIESQLEENTKLFFSF